MKRLFVAFAALCLLQAPGSGMSPGTGRAETGTRPDPQPLYRHLRKTFSLPGEMQLELKGLKPSPVAGFLSGVIETRYRGNTQSQPVLVSADGRYYFLSEPQALAPAKLPGFVGPAQPPQAAGGRPQPVYVTSDLKYYLLDEPRDTSVDPDAANRAKIATSNAPARGPASAPVTLVEFSDLQCPHCRHAHRLLEAELAKAYGNKVRWVLKQFPLNQHPFAFNAAVAVACAFRQNPGSAWRLESALFGFFERHEPKTPEKPGDKVPPPPPAATPESLREEAAQAAAAAGLDAPRFRACYDKRESKGAVEADMKEGEALAVGSTPTFFVNGRRVLGLADFQSLRPVIDEMLAERKP